MQPEDLIGKYIGYECEETGSLFLAYINKVLYKNNMKTAENTWLITNRMFIYNSGLNEYHTDRIVFWKNIMQRNFIVYDNLSIPKEQIESFKEKVYLDGILSGIPLKFTTMLLIHKVLPDSEKDQDLEELLQKKSVKDLLGMTLLRY